VSTQSSTYKSHFNETAHYINGSWGLFLESAGNFSGPWSQSKIPKLTIAELFYSHILNMNRGSLHPTSPFLHTEWTKNGFPGLLRNGPLASLKIEHLVVPSGVRWFHD